MCVSNTIKFNTTQGWMIVFCVDNPQVDCQRWYRKWRCSNSDDATRKYKWDLYQCFQCIDTALYKYYVYNVCNSFTWKPSQLYNQHSINENIINPVHQVGVSVEVLLYLFVTSYSISTLIKLWKMITRQGFRPFPNHIFAPRVFCSSCLRPAIGWL